MELLILMAMYGLTFALQHKIPALLLKETYREFSFEKFRKKLLSCTFCMGFHAGWAMYLVSILGELKVFNIGDFLIFAFASAAFSYTIDTYVQKLEQSELGNEDIYEE